MQTRPSCAVQFTRGEIISQPVTAVVRKPEFPGARVPGRPNRVTNPLRPDFCAAFAGYKTQDLTVRGSRQTDVAGNSHCKIQRAVRPKGQRVHGMPALGGQVFKENLGRGRLWSVPSLIGPPGNAGDLRDVQIAVAPGDARRGIKPSRHHAHALCASIAVAIDNGVNAITPRAHEQHPGRTHGQLPRTRHVGVNGNFETGRNLREWRRDFHRGGEAREQQREV